MCVHLTVYVLHQLTYRICSEKQNHYNSTELFSKAAHLNQSKPSKFNFVGKVETNVV